jgi:hypothetical protein
MIDTAECRSAYGVVGPMPAAATAGVKYRARHDDHRIAASVGERLTGASSPETGLCARR